jgi:hypothetical protein
MFWWLRILVDCHPIYFQLVQERLGVITLWCSGNENMKQKVYFLVEIAIGNHGPGIITYFLWKGKHVAERKMRVIDRNKQVDIFQSEMMTPG